MKVVFITEQCTAAEFEEAAVIFILCDEDVKEIEGAAEVVNFNDLSIYQNTENINLSFQCFGNKLLGFIALVHWVAEIDRNFKSITPKPDLLIVVSECDIDVDMKIFDQAVEKLNIPIVFLNKDSEEYLVVGAAYETGEGFFSLDI